MFLQINLEKGCNVVGRTRIKYSLKEDKAVLFDLGNRRVDNSIMPDFFNRPDEYRLHIGDYCTITAPDNETLLGYIHEIAQAAGKKSEVCAITLHSGESIIY